MQQKSELFNMLVEDFQTPTFLREFTQRLPLVYNMADDRSFGEDLISQPFKKLYFGHSRYFLSQSLFWDVAQLTKTNAKIDYCESNGFPIVSVFQQRFRFTLHHGITPNEVSLINTSLIRKQNSAINDELVQPSLFPESADFNPNKLREAKNIYANIVHGCGGKGSSFEEYGFVRIAIPYVKTTHKASGKTQEKFMFVENVNLFEVLQTLIENEQSANQAKPTVNIAMPKIKKTA